MKNLKASQQYAAKKSIIFQIMELDEASCKKQNIPGFMVLIMKDMWSARLWNAGIKALKAELKLKSLTHKLYVA